MVLALVVAAFVGGAAALPFGESRLWVPGALGDAWFRLMLVSTYAVLAFVAVYAVITALHALARRIGVAAFGADGIASEAPDPADAGSGRRKLAAFLFWMVGLPIVAFVGMGDGGGISNTWAGESLQIDPLFWRLVMVPFGVMCLVSAVLAVARRAFGVVTAVGVAGMAIAVLAGIAGYGGTAVYYFAFFGFLLYLVEPSKATFRPLRGGEP